MKICRVKKIKTKVFFFSLLFTFGFLFVFLATNFQKIKKHTHMKLKNKSMFIVLILFLNQRKPFFLSLSFLCISMNSFTIKSIHSFTQVYLLVETDTEHFFSSQDFFLPLGSFISISIKFGIISTHWQLFGIQLDHLGFFPRAVVVLLTSYNWQYGSRNS